MIVLGEPYVSPLLVESIVKYRLPVLANTLSQTLIDADLLTLPDNPLLNNKLAVEPMLYTNSENCLDYIYQHYPDYLFLEQTRIMKDKFQFRNLMHELDPDFYYQEFLKSELTFERLAAINYPYVIKPSIGFFSLNVYTIFDDASLVNALTDIHESLADQTYNEQVVNQSRFIVEEYISGDEYAIDAYYNANGEPVVLDILRHYFSSAEDVSDTLYVTNTAVIQEHLDVITTYLTRLNQKLNLKNYPFHLEVKMNQGKVQPIEINPMRFAGWCTTDIAHYAYGINPYEYFYHQKKPDFAHLNAQKKDKFYSIVILNKKRIDTVQSFDYDKLKREFEHVLEIRPVDFNQFPIYGFMFIETSESNRSELERILTLDFDQYAF